MCALQFRGGISIDHNLSFSKLVRDGREEERRRTKTLLMYGNSEIMILYFLSNRASTVRSYLALVQHCTNLREPSRIHTVLKVSLTCET